MTNALARYKNLSDIADYFNQYMIGYDNFVNRFDGFGESVSNYPPFNFSTKDNITYHLEMALSGYSRDNLKVYTEGGVLFIEANKEEEDLNLKYYHRGLSRRSFKWKRALSDDLHVKEVKFENGILDVTLNRVVPEVYQRKDYL